MVLAEQLDQGGVAGDIDLLRVDQARLQAEYDRTTALFARLDATVQLYSARGGGWHD